MDLPKHPTPNTKIIFYTHLFFPMSEIDPSLKLQVITSGTKRELCGHIGSGVDSPTEAYFDLQTGKIEVLLVEDSLDSVSMDEEEEAIILKEVIETELGSRYLEVFTMISPEAFKIMEAFTASPYAKEAKPHLAQAMRRRKPFRSFMNVLLNYPEIRETWFVFEEEFQFNWLKIRYLAEYEVELVDEETTLDTH